jgi:quinol monooxygenase YgiN
MPLMKGIAMTAFNVVRFRVKPGREQAFIDAHRRADTAFRGFVRGSLVKTDERRFCMIGEWDSFDSLAKARPQMIALLDSFRDDLEDLGGGLGVTDPVSGEVVLDLKP